MPASIFNGDAIKILKDKLRFKDGTEITSTEAGYLAGTTSDIQTQFSGKASTALDNLSSPFVNTDLRFAGTNSLILQNDVYLKSRNSANTGNLNVIKVGTDNQTRISGSGTILAQTNFSPETNNSFNCGDGFRYWANVYSYYFRAPGFGITLDGTGPSGSNIAGFRCNNLTSLGAFTENRDVADAVGTTSIFVDTGNVLNAASTGSSGLIRIRTGTANGTAGNTGGVELRTGNSVSGNSGNIDFITGTAASGTRGSICMVERSISTALTGYVWTLQNNSTGEGAWSAVPSGGNKVVASYSSATTAGGSDEVILLSGASFTLSLPTAVGITGKVYEIVHNGTSLSQVYTIDANGSETIRGSLTFLMHTNGQRVRIVSDGANWQVLDSYTSTAWTSAGAITIGATTSAPTKGSTIQTDTMFWKRVGNTAHIRMYYRQTSASGAAAGSGDYLFDISSIGNMDTTKIVTYSAAEGWASSYQNAFAVGDCAQGSGTNQGTGVVVPYDATQVRMFSEDSANAGVIGSAGYQLTNANVFYALDFIVPIDGWEE